MAIRMGSDGLDEEWLATTDDVCEHGGEQWWLSLVKCRRCGCSWMVAQESRIFDAYILRRLDGQRADQIVESGRWPAEFQTYEGVLAVGRGLLEPCRFFELLSPSLVYTVEDLVKRRPRIPASEVGYLIGLSEHEAAYLMSLPLPAPDALDWVAWQKRIEAMRPPP
jgi:hypothetical protein